MESTTLDKILTKVEIKEVEKMLRLPDNEIVPALKLYLNKRKKQLTAKGVLPDYLAYALYAKSKNLIP